MRAAIGKETIVIRNPCSIRPYQHVLEPVYVYLMIAAMQYKELQYAGSYNVGPDETDCCQTGKLVDLFVHQWGEGLTWTCQSDHGPHEANFLKLDCARLKNVFGWKPRWTLETAVSKVVEWTKCWQGARNIEQFTDQQIKEFLQAGEKICQRKE